MDLALPRAGAITGRVSDDRGQPRVGAIIAVQRYQYDEQGQKRLVPAAGGLPMLTDDRGEFRAFGLMPGEYVVSATARTSRPPGQAQSALEGYLPTYYPGTPNEADAQPVTLGIGEESSVQFALVRGRLSRVSGTVTDSAGRPAAGAALSLATRAGSGVSTSPGGSVAADGSFTIPNVPPGEHAIQVRLQPRTGEAAAEMANATITVSGADVTDVRIRTTPGTTLTGRVEWQGRARPAAGAAPLRIAATPVDGRLSLPFRLAAGAGSAAVAADGTFRLTALFGRLHIAPLATPQGWALATVSVDGVDVTDGGFDASGLASGRVRVVLTDTLTELSGTVKDAAAGRAPDAVVVVLPENAVGTPGAARYVRAVAADQGGTFQTRGLPPGRYVAAAVEGLETGSEWDPAFQAMVRSAGRRFTLAQGQALTLDLSLMR